VPAFLILNSEAAAATSYELKKGERVLLGRDWQCRIVVNDVQCSRVHAEIFFEEDGWWVRDNQSSNGTYVNGQVIDQARLVNGAELRIGGSVFVFSEQSKLPQSASEATTREDTQKTIILDHALKVSGGPDATLDFLKGHDWGKDFFFLFQLSVKLLSLVDPEQVIEVCVRRLSSRTNADIAGFLWLSDSGVLNPKFVLPTDRADELELDPDLTKRVVAEEHAIRAEYDTKLGVVDSICVPLILDDKVIAVLHLYRCKYKFPEGVFELAVAVASIMVRGLNTTNRYRSLAAEHSSLVQKSAAFDELLGQSPAMLELKSRISRVAKASGCVLVRGESGSGKELVARALHRSSPRANRPMLSVNCAAIPRDLMESQLFGHKKGAFTSADRDHIGWFQQADLGTLFLDEIGELTLEGQAKLLRTLEGHPFLPVGGTEEVKVDVRVICATNRDLKEFVSEKKFREDLFYRLTVYELYIPPLRDRGADIQHLINFFFDHFKNQHGKPQLKLSAAANARLLAYQWPGNVRQLRNMLDSAVVMAEGDEIELADLGIREPSQTEFETLRIEYWERKLIIDALQRTSNNMPKAAELLGISRATLYRKIDQYGINR
jgi:two-component system, NtrC family, response regulator HydG